MIMEYTEYNHHDPFLLLNMLCCYFKHLWIRIIPSFSEFLTWKSIFIPNDLPIFLSANSQPVNFTWLQCVEIVRNLFLRSKKQPHRICWNGWVDIARKLQPTFLPEIAFDIILENKNNLPQWISNQPPSHQNKQLNINQQSSKQPLPNNNNNKKSNPNSPSKFPKLTKT